ncbi:MAG TPA: 1,4-alpha-glucan branching protein GlgB [Nitrospiraceae bacterium]|nr:1,4-alpha-glucan branching protein GlgB [Nitrospiraceae bacterium]
MALSLRDDVERLLRAEHWDPFSVLGPHPVVENGRAMLAVRVFAPDAREVSVILDHGEASPMMHVLGGLFETTLPADTPSRHYRIRMTDQWGEVTERHDPYAFPGLISEFDLHLFAEGKLFRAYDVLGGHVRTIDGVTGVRFVVWAPNAMRVSVVGDFNGWDGRRHPMRNCGGSGLWELFIPDIPEGTAYKYEIRPRNHDVPLLKADPYAFAAELRPKTASLIHALSYEWRDHEWMTRRGSRDTLSEPISIYEVHFGSWMRVPEESNRWLTYRELTSKLIPYVKELGYTHVELMPVTEHPFDGSWGYQTVGYFAPTSRFGKPEEFMAFVDACHQANIGVILDWVPAHFPDDPHGLAWFDGTHLYDHQDPRLGYHPEWHSRIFNFGRVEVRNFLFNSALFWLDRYHIDGLRVDAVASMLYLDYARKAGEWIPNRFGGNENLEAVDFLKEFNALVHREHPGVLTIAEESTAWPGVSRPTYVGGLGFSLKWNMGWMHDTLEYFSLDPVYRKHHQNKITFGLVYAFSENFVLVLSHDEVVHGKKTLLDKMPGDQWQRFANMRALLGFMYGHPGKKMLFMGGEIGQWWEWNHDNSLQWHLLQYEPHQGLRRYASDLNRLYQAEPALYQADFDWSGFQWIDFSDADHAVIAFLRRARDPENSVICACNFTPVPRSGYRVGVPAPGWYRELLNSDADLYGGSNIGNGGGLASEAIPWHGHPHSLLLTLPPLSVIFFKRAG